MGFTRSFTGAFAGGAGGGEVTTPTAPQNLVATIGDTQIVLTWSAPASDGGAAITDYIVQYKETSSGTWLTFSDGVSATTGATVTGLTNNTSYDFRVAAVNSVGTGAYTAAVTKTPFDANLQARFDSGAGLTFVGSDISTWADADGRAITLDQVVGANRPVEAVGGGVLFGTSEFLTSNIALTDGFFIAVFKVNNPFGATGASGNLASYALGPSNTEIVFGSNTGTLANEVITYRYGESVWREAISATALNTAVGATTITSGVKHILAVSYNGSSQTVFNYDGTPIIPDLANGVRAGSPVNRLLNIGARSDGTRSLDATFYEIRTYSAEPNVAAEVAALIAKWGV